MRPQGLTGHGSPPGTALRGPGLGKGAHRPRELTRPGALHRPGLGEVGLTVARLFCRLHRSFTTTITSMPPTTSPSITPHTHPTLPTPPHPTPSWRLDHFGWHRGGPVAAE